MINEQNTLMATIQELINFVNDGTESDLTRCIAKYCSAYDETARVACIKLLHWIRGRGNLGTKSKLRLENYPWCNGLRDSLVHCQPLEKVFEVGDDWTNFRSDLDEATVDEIEARVLAQYKGTLFITRRPKK
jgi:hypothetical protein